MTSPLAVLRRPLAIAAATAGAAMLGGLTLVGGLALLEGTASAPARAQGTSGLLEFRWDNDRNYRKLYYFITDTGRLRRSEYYLVLKPKDRKTAILKLSITIPDNFDVKIDPKDVKLCVMKEGGMTSRTRCLKEIPAVVEIPKGGRSIDIFPNTPVSDDKTIGVYINLFNPFNIGMYQFNALAQAPGDVPMAGYLGSWIIEIDPSN